MKKSSFMRLCALMMVLYVCNKAFAAFGDNNLAPIASPALIVEKGETNAQGKFACVNYGCNAIKSFPGVSLILADGTTYNHELVR